MESTRIRIVLRWLGRCVVWCVALIAVLIGTLPFWLGFALKKGLPEMVRFDQYERDGYTGFSLHGTVIETESFAGNVNRVTTLYPWTWLYRSLNGLSESPYVAIGTGSFSLLATETEASEGGVGELVYSDVFAELEKGLLLTDRWMSHFVAEKLSVVASEKTFTIEELRWKDRQLSLSANTDLISKSKTTVAVDLSQFPYQIEMDNEGHQVGFELSLIHI